MVVSDLLVYSVELAPDALLLSSAVNFGVKQLVVLGFKSVH